MSQAFDHTDEPQHGETSLTRKVDRMGMLVHRYYQAQARTRGALGDPLRGQGRVLALLAAKPQTTQRELSYLLDMRQQSLSELLAKLEEKGFVTREKSAEDGRVSVVHLTDEGAQAAPSPDQMEDEADALACLTADEQAQLEALADKVTASLEAKLKEMGEDPQSGPRRGKGDRDGKRHGDGERKGRYRGEDHDRGPRHGGSSDSRRGPHRPDDGGRPYRGPHRSERDGRPYGDDRSHRGPYRPEGDDRSHRGPYRRNDGYDDHRMRQA